MSQDNVELVRGLYALGTANVLAMSPEETDVAFRDHLDEEFEFRLPPDYPEGDPTFHGREGLARLRALLGQAWGEWRIEPQRYLDGGDRVVVFARIVAEGGGSGVPLELETTHVWTIRAGRAVSLHAYRRRDEALAAAGLSG